jgi:TPP-dependent pyruvate/acetoin dehydrogenase alpha subunit
MESTSQDFAAKAVLQQMIRIREFESIVASGREEGLIGGPTHLCSGQEAIAAGVSLWLTPQDYVFSAHRSHGHALALGCDPRELFAEILGRKTGTNGGFGGSMHISDPKRGFIGAVPIVAGTVPIAIGAAFTAKYRGTGEIAVVYFGDGAMEEGVVHESLNLAKILSLPILFVCENNYFSSHMHVSIRQPNDHLFRFAEAHEIHGKSIDGNDALAVMTSAKELIQIARAGEGPVFLEAKTYRHFGHVDWRKDLDVGLNRSKDDLEAWMLLDPIPRLMEHILKNSILSEAQFENIVDDEKKLLSRAWEEASNDPLPDEKLLMTGVYLD